MIVSRPYCSAGGDAGHYWKEGHEVHAHRVYSTAKTQGRYALASATLHELATYVFDVVPS